MGLIRLNLPTHEPLRQRFTKKNNWMVHSFEFTPAATVVRHHADHLTFEFSEGESASFYLLWKQLQRQRVIHSATLSQFEPSFEALVELGRGTLNRVRNLMHDMLHLDFPLTDEIRERLKRLTRRFCRLLLDEPSRAQHGFAVALIDDTLQLTDEIVQGLLHIQFEHRLKQQPEMLLGATVSHAIDRPEEYLELFNAIRICPDWSVVEASESAMNFEELDRLFDWAYTHELHVSLGPVIDTVRGRFPSWLEQWSGDLPNLNAFFSDFLATLHHRFSFHDCQIWSGLNLTTPFQISPDERLRLGVRLLETAQSLNREASWSIGIVSPWGDYLKDESPSFSPLLLADTLLRGELPIGRFNLLLLNDPEDRWGYPRDLLDNMQLMQYYGSLGKPLELTVTPGYASYSLPELVRFGLSSDLVTAMFIDGRQPQNLQWQLQDIGLDDKAFLKNLQKQIS